MSIWWLLDQPGQARKTSLFPEISGDHGAVEIQPADIWHSTTADSGYGFTTLMSVNVVDDDEEPVHETLLLGSASTIYVSPSNIYVTFQTGQADLEDVYPPDSHRPRPDRVPRDWEVPGWLLNQFSMDEQGEYFSGGYHIVECSTLEARQANNVYILDQKLDVYGYLENWHRASRYTRRGSWAAVLPSDLQAGGPFVCH